MSASRLLRVVNELAGARDLPSVTAIVGSAARELTGADGITFVMRDHGDCYYADEDAIAPLWKGRRFPLESCTSGWAMLHASPVVLPDIYADSRIPHDAYRPTFVKSLAMVPVRSPEPVAAIGAYWAHYHEATDIELQVMGALADSTALALANVQLLDQLRSAVTREHEARLIAERATAAKDEFLATIAHELRQPLHASLAALRLMAIPSDRAVGERAHAVVERQMRHMNCLVEDLLDAGRVMRGHVELRREPIDLGIVVRQAAEAMRPMMLERQHQFTVTAPDVPVTVRADEARLQQVLMNLLSNAAKYTDPGGRIALSLVARDPEAIVTVADNGRGIEPSVLPRVFDLFTRGASEGSGFGVGLTVARRLIELHGGTIDARSGGAGHGSEFLVRLPVGAASTV